MGREWEATLEWRWFKLAGFESSGFSASDTLTYVAGHCFLGCRRKATIVGFENEMTKVVCKWDENGPICTNIKIIVIDKIT